MARSVTVWRMLKLCAVLAAAAFLIGCTTRTAAFGPVLLSEDEKACLSDDSLEAIELNNTAWLRANP